MAKDSAGSRAQAMAGQVDSSRFAELRKRLLFVLGAIVVFRVGSFIPVPGVDPAQLAEFVASQKGTIIDFANTFGGGALERLSILALGVMPYISASIIMQLMSVIVPSLNELRKEGESGRRKITQYTRYGTLVLAAFQSVGAVIALQGQGVIAPGPGFIFTAAVSLITGTMFLVWLGEQITERGIGNGISIIIFAGIVAGLPSAIAGTGDMVSNGEMSSFLALGLFVMVMLVIAAVIFVERGQRRITINYARRQQGRQIYAAQSSFLPLKLNMAGVIPPIFASSIILFPTTIAGWFAAEQGEAGWLQTITSRLTPGEPAYAFLYGAMIVFFCFFYTALVFNSRETADNLKRSGAFIPGIRPGDQTAKYIDGVLTRLTIWGAAYITLVCLIPEFLIGQFNVPFYFGGTSLLIVVVVVMDFMAQVQAQLMSQQYDGLLTKQKVKQPRAGAVARR